MNRPTRGPRSRTASSPCETVNNLFSGERTLTTNDEHTGEVDHGGHVATTSAPIPNDVGSATHAAHRHHGTGSRRRSVFIRAADRQWAGEPQ